MGCPFAQHVLERVRGYRDGSQFSLNLRPNALRLRIDFFLVSALASPELSKIAHIQQTSETPYHDCEVKVAESTTERAFYLSISIVLCVSGTHINSIGKRSLVDELLKKTVTYRSPASFRWWLWCRR